MVWADPNQFYSEKPDLDRTSLKKDLGNFGSPGEETIHLFVCRKPGQDDQFLGNGLHERLSQELYWSYFPRRKNFSPQRVA